MGNTDQATDSVQAKAFIALCRRGRLYDIDKWIAAGMCTIPEKKGLVDFRYIIA